MKVKVIRKTVPQGLKPIIYCCNYGTTKVVPFQIPTFIIGFQ